jgi:hypothetical protein
MLCGCDLRWFVQENRPDSDIKDRARDDKTKFAALKAVVMPPFAKNGRRMGPTRSFVAGTQRNLSSLQPPGGTGIRFVISQ